MKNNKKLIFIAGIILTLLLIMLLRGVVVRAIANSKIDKLEERYGLIISYEKMSMSGLAGVEISDLSVTPVGADTLLSAKKIIARLNPFRLIFLRPDLNYLELDKAGISFVKKDSISNFDFLYSFGKDSSGNNQSSEIINQKNYSALASSLFSLFLDLMPSRAKLSNVYLSYSNKDYNLKITLLESSVKDDKYTSLIVTDENGSIERLSAEGSLSDKERSVSAIFVPKDSTMFRVPFLDYRWSAKLMFDTLSLDIKGNNLHKEVINFSGMAEASSVKLFHTGISPEVVTLKSGQIAYSLNIGTNFAELDSASVFKINNIKVSPWIKIEKMSDWIFSASLRKQIKDAQELFSSLPSGLFLGLDGITAEGSLDYRFRLHLDMSNIDSLKLESSLKGNNFRITKMGRANLRLMNEDFLHTVYEKGVAVRSFAVGRGNPSFTSLDNISPYLKMAVLQSEDGGFLHHNGFVPEGIRGAMVENIKKGRFARGGSSISMQLVKNVYLSRHKTLARKFEEMLMVWIIENNRLVPKERMFEVYLNIIEWGPGIYGIREASKFWFDKEPSRLNINESIFLASIVPSPRRGARNFNPDYTLKEEMKAYYDLLAERLWVKEVISEKEKWEVKAEVKLSESARNLVDLVYQPNQNE
ncbi:MAG: biosynthetic peptidoglycan transglycosylase [Bacteroidales bacterium]|jgi:hypothetical protein|nr:biosynthetic peptidoglycan transglycosylase [Bacteroidales bacterium]